MAQILIFPIGRDRLYATLSRCERDFVETLLHLFPNYSYDLSGLTKLNPSPAPGVASAAAAAKTIIALIREGGASGLRWGGQYDDADCDRKRVRVRSCAQETSPP